MLHRRWNLYLTAILFITLGGCATFSTIEKGIDPLLGGPVDRLIDYIGYPAAEQNIAGKRLLIWSTSNIVTLPRQQQTSITGSIGSKPVYGTATTWGSESVDGKCTIKVEVDENNIMKSWVGEGNIFGCEVYANRFRTYSRGAKGDTAVDDVLAPRR